MGRDITDLRTWQDFVHLAFILDCCIRTIAGWHLATQTCAPTGCSDALGMANGQCRPDAG